MTSTDLRLSRRVAEQFTAGRFVLLVDDRSGTGALVMPAHRATRESIAFLVRHTSGFVCVALSAQDCDELDLAPMAGSGWARSGSRFTVTVDAKDCPGTGISATDRSQTIRLLGAQGTSPAAFTRPGHVVPVRVDQSTATRDLPGAALALVQAAGQGSAAVFAEVVGTSNPAEMASPHELRQFAAIHQLATAHTTELLEPNRPE